MDKRVREISCFFVALPRLFPLSICARVHESTQRFIHKYLQLSAVKMNFEMRFGEESILMGVTSIFLSFPPFIPSFIP